MKYRIPVVFERAKMLEIEAGCIEEAIAIAYREASSEGGEYVEDSYRVDGGFSYELAGEEPPFRPMGFVLDTDVARKMAADVGIDLEAEDAPTDRQQLSQEFLEDRYCGADGSCFSDADPGL